MSRAAAPWNELSPKDLEKIAPVKALLALLAVTAVWGVTFVQVKDAVAVYPLFAFLALRFVLATLVLAAPGAPRLPRPRPTPRPPPPPPGPPPSPRPPLPHAPRPPAPPP